MRIFIFISFVIFSAFVTHQENRPSGSLEGEVDQCIQPYLDLKGFSGTILMAKGGRILLTKGYGMANYELNVPSSPRTKFHLASVSKTFTAAAIMILQQRGQLSVRDPLKKFLPDFQNGERITIHHLLTNTSGIPNINNFPEYNTWSTLPHTPADLVEKISGRPLDFEPGTKGYTESNSNYNLLAYIIERVSGKTYGDFLRETIFAPLAMEETGHDSGFDTLLTDRADGYVSSGLTGLANAPYINWSVKSGNGSIYSTVTDLYKWDRALYDDRILQKVSRDSMFGREYGWFNGKRVQRNVVRMSGRSPGFQCEIQRYTDDNACVIVLGNNYTPTASVIANALAAILFDEKYEKEEIIRPVMLDQKLLDSFTGQYRFGDDFYSPNALYSVSATSEYLLLKFGNELYVLVPQGQNVFFSRDFWSRIEFSKNTSGSAVELIWKYGTNNFSAKRVGD